MFKNKLKHLVAVDVRRLAFCRRKEVGGSLRRLLRVELLPLLACLTGCRSLPPLPAANFSEPGWIVHQGQAVWRQKHGAPDIAGEILVATNGGGKTFVQFTKTPFPL